MSDSSGVEECRASFGLALEGAAINLWKALLETNTIHHIVTDNAVDAEEVRIKDHCSCFFADLAHITQSLRA